MALSADLDMLPRADGGLGVSVLTPSAVEADPAHVVTNTQSKRASECERQTKRKEMERAKMYKPPNSSRRSPLPLSWKSSTTFGERLHQCDKANYNTWGNAYESLFLLRKPSPEYTTVPA